MMALIPANAHGEYFIDRYHCLRKIETTLDHENKRLGKTNSLPASNHNHPSNGWFAHRL
nr:hypothetical protein [Limosilactobacillus reuteri]